jgi:hypothetical protein
MKADAVKSRCARDGAGGACTAAATPHALPRAMWAARDGWMPAACRISQV